MDILEFFKTDDATELDWRQREDVRTAQARHREAAHRLETATARRLDVWRWRDESDGRLRLQHFTEWPQADIEFREAELNLHETQTALMKVEAAAKNSVRAAWQEVYRKAFASVEAIALGAFADRLQELGELWDRGNALGIALPVACCDCTLSPQGLSEWAAAVRKELGS